MLKTRDEYVHELSHGADLSSPKAARAIDYLIQAQIIEVREPEHWGRIMEFPLYELSSKGRVRSYHTKKIVPANHIGEVTLHLNDGTAHQIFIDALFDPTIKAA